MNENIFVNPNDGADCADGIAGKSNGRARRLWAALGVSFALAFVCITIVSKCSFLYRFNDWADANWFMTVGHGIADGLVPYRDMFEQKGVYIYFLFALGYLISSNSFTGIYLFELIFATAYLFAAYNILRLWLTHAKSLLALVPVAVFTYCSEGFAMGGGAVEEYCLPMLTFFLYVFLRYSLGADGRVPLWHAVLCGFFAGAIFWMKYTMLVFCAATAACIFIDMCIRRNAKAAALYVLALIAGCVVSFLPALVYLGVNGAIGDMWQVYIINNIFDYGEGTTAEIVGKIGNTVANIGRNFFLYLFAVFALVFFIKNGHIPRRFKVFYIVSTALFFVAQGLLQGAHLYYHLAFAVYLPLGIVGARYCIQGVCNFIGGIVKRCKKGGQDGAVGTFDVGAKAARAALKLKLGVNARTVGLCLAATVVACLIFGNCTIEIFFSKSYYPQFAVAERIEEDGGEDATFLTYKMVDQGFYTACDRSPDFYYFALNNFSREGYPEIYDEQESYVACGLAVYVITTVEVWESEKGTLLSRYELLEEYSYRHFESHFWNGIEEYALLKLKA